MSSRWLVDYGPVNHGRIPSECRQNLLLLEDSASDITCNNECHCHKIRIAYRTKKTLRWSPVEKQITICPHLPRNNAKLPVVVAAPSCFFVSLLVPRSASSCHRVPIDMWHLSAAGFCVPAECCRWVEISPRQDSAGNV